MVGSLDGLDPLHVDALDLRHLADEQVDQVVRRQRHHEVVHGPPATALEDLDPDHVRVHRADAAGHLSQRARTVGQPEAQHVAGHGATVPSASSPDVTPPFPVREPAMGGLAADERG